MNSTSENSENADNTEEKKVTEVPAPFPIDDAELIEQARLINEEPEEQTQLTSKKNDGTDTGEHLLCPQCRKVISENWLLECPHCNYSLGSPELLAQTAAKAKGKISSTTKKELATAFQEWFQNGKEAFRNGNFEEAQADLRQAVLRAPESDSIKKNEQIIEARELLAMVLEKLGKADEAKQEYIVLSEQATSPEERDKFAQLAKNTGGKVPPKEILERAVKNSEGAMQTLFCGFCRRPLLEAEVYAYKRSRTSFRCICGFEGSPLTYASNESSKQFRIAAAKHRALLIAAASPKVKGGRNQSTAVILSCLLGGVGAHKFYLEDYLMGSIYLTLCWTLIPAAISILDAIHLAHMSRVTFNLTYNLESILERLPEDPNFAGQTHSDLLSMQRGEDALPAEDIFEPTP